MNRLTHGYHAFAADLNIDIESIHCLAYGIMILHLILLVGHQDTSGSTGMSSVIVEFVFI